MTFKPRGEVLFLRGDLRLRPDYFANPAFGDLRKKPRRRLNSTLDVTAGIVTVARNPKEYALSHGDRVHEIQRKFGASALKNILSLLDQVANKNDKTLGAIVFLAREKHPEDIPSLIQLANEYLESLVSEVIGSAPQIAPKKHAASALWQGGKRCRGRPE